MARERIKDYDEAGWKTQVVIDYCAQEKVVPKKDPGASVPDDWTGMSSKSVQRKILDKTGVEMASGEPGFAWERIGGKHATGKAMDFLEDRRDDFVHAGIDQLAAWNN